MTVAALVSSAESQSQAFDADASETSSESRIIGPKYSAKQKMHREVDDDRECDHQNNNEQRPGHNDLRLFAEAVDPVHVLARVTEQIRERQYHDRGQCLPQPSTSIVSKPIKRPHENDRQ